MNKLMSTNLKEPFSNFNSILQPEQVALPSMGAAVLQQIDYALDQLFRSASSLQHLDE